MSDLIRSAQLIRCLDLTSLNGNETGESISRLCDKAVQHGCAAVCIYPNWVEHAAALLAGCKPAVVTVVNFPDGDDDAAEVVSAVIAAIDAGADELDIVAPLSAIEEGDVELVTELAAKVKEAASEAPIKMILETGRLTDPALITAAGRAAVMGGVDFLKTSTGKHEIGASSEAVKALTDIALEANGRVGIKLSGGIRTAEQAQKFTRIIADQLGVNWLSPDHFRIGASTLLDDLLVAELNEAPHR